jgi:hypothetical protein
MTEQRYIRRLNKPCNWHSDESCEKLEGSDYVAIDADNVPDTATACSFCADGLNGNALRARFKST